MCGWIITVAVVMVVGFNMLIIFCLTAASSLEGYADSEEDNREQMAALREYSIQKALKEQKKEERKKKRMNRSARWKAL